MRIPLLTAVIAAAITSAGCAKVSSLNGFVADNDAVVDPSLTGLWQDKDGEESYAVRQDGPKYLITAITKSAAVTFEGRLLESGALRILDLTVKEESPGQVAVHIPILLRQEGSALSVSYFDTEWLRQCAIKELGAHAIEDRTIIGSDGSAVRNFLLKYGDDPRARGEQTTLYKVR